MIKQHTLWRSNTAMITLVAAAFLLCCLAGGRHQHVAHAFTASPSSYGRPLSLQKGRHLEHLEEQRPRNCPTYLEAKVATRISSDSWFPLVPPLKHADDSPSDGKILTPEQRQNIESKSIELAARLLKNRMDAIMAWQQKDESSYAWSPSQDARIKGMVENRFMDLACTEKGENSLESLFVGPDIENEANDYVVRGAIMAIQSLCVYGTQVGVQGTREQLRRLISHLDHRRNPSLIQRDLLEEWDCDSVRRLKYQLERTPAAQLLSKLIWKRLPQGAFDLLVELNAWEPHEDVALLRSGFPLRFAKEELDAATQRASQYDEIDAESLLGIRKDLRHLKACTIDGSSTSEIDDGLSVEKIISKNENGEDETRHRIWIHIADADRLAPPGSDLFEVARKRITSLYLPRGPISMFPPLVSTDLMSLRSNEDSYALSMGLEIKSDGSIDESSIEITPSLIRVDYRLTYDDVDEMLEEGIGYAEEWELGVLLDVATTRREYRIRNGSSEGLIPNPIPYNSVSTYSDANAPDGIGVSVKVEVSHNAGRNQTSESNEWNGRNSRVMENTVPASSSFLLVTEAMIMAGEALGRWKCRMEQEENTSKTKDSSFFRNRLRLPFRTQPKPDYLSRARERRILDDLAEYNVGDGLCYSWYARRFLMPVRVREEMFPHSGLGLECYVQWTSPIRRFSDLQVHASVKRYLRRKRLNELLEAGAPIPSKLTARQVGVPSAEWQEILQQDEPQWKLEEHDLDTDIKYMEGIGLIGASKILQRQSQQYWLFQYVDRLYQQDTDITFNAVALGCTDPEKQQYAIYVYELGLEHRFLSGAQLDPGTKLRLKIQQVLPRHGQLSFVRVS
mmetsp:Transcript_11463/g.15096  ORF Transcript_11463/g.15096 Transcript_11463/m.15096 type:complete len:849 (+) Transcript_11463:86-2632(+)